MNKTENMILVALANGEKIEGYNHFSGALHDLHKLGFIHCIFDEQGHVITGNITKEGIKYIKMTKQ